LLIKSREETFSLHYFISIGFFFSIFVKQDADSNQAVEGCPKVSDAEVPLVDQRSINSHRRMSASGNSSQERWPNDTEPTEEERKSYFCIFLRIEFFINNIRTNDK